MTSRVIVVTGLAGAGRTTILHALEDLGYFCVDNLPPAVMLPTRRSCEEVGIDKTAFGVDSRVRSFLKDAKDQVKHLSNLPGVKFDMLFAEAANQTLVRRFSASRRPHPVVQGLTGEMPPLLEAIREERRLLSGMRALATMVIDTTDLSVHQLRAQVQARFIESSMPQQMRVRVMSFGFKYGVPLDADLVFDVRFMANPYFDEQLRPLSGKDPQIDEYVFGDPKSRGFLENLEGLLEQSLPLYADEGKSYLTIAIGCTGGRHRSVASAIRIDEWLKALGGFSVTVDHRDIGREGKN